MARAESAARARIGVIQRMPREGAWPALAAMPIVAARASAPNHTA